MLHPAVSLKGDDMALTTMSLINGNQHTLGPSDFPYMRDCRYVDISQTKVPPRFELGSQDSES